jgi:alpha-tubulin suppressor-like RCC1 family protein
MNVLCILFLVLCTRVLAQSGCRLRCWGNNCVEPDFSNDVVVTEAAGGLLHALALFDNGTIYSWGNNSYGQSEPPNNLSLVLHVAAGGQHTVVVQTDGKVVCWGNGGSGQCDVPPYTNVQNISSMTDFTVVRFANNSVGCFGLNDDNQCDVPGGIQATGISAGGRYSLALLTNNTLVCWGDNSYGQCNISSNLNAIQLFSAGYGHAVAVLSNTSIICWGYNLEGECNNIPTGIGMPIQIATGWWHTLILLSNGSVSCFGYNGEGQCDVPADLRNVTSIFAGGSYSFAIDCPRTDEETTTAPDPTTTPFPTVTCSAVIDPLQSECITECTINEILLYSCVELCIQDQVTAWNDYCGEGGYIIPGCLDVCSPVESCAGYCCDDGCSFDTILAIYAPVNGLLISMIVFGVIVGVGIVTFLSLYTLNLLK